ncbi:MAG: branched-chain amino acid ABC transporter substrate-binding protein [Inhella sp.]
MRHLQRRHWLGVSLLAGLGLSGCAPKASSLRIGVAQPLSGPLAALGQDLLRGAELAAQRINAGAGIKLGNSKLPIEILGIDDRGDSQAGTQAAAQLVEAGVLAVIGHLNSGVSIAAAPVYAKAGVPQLAISTNPRYTQLGLPTTLRLVANDDVQAQAMAQYAVDKLGAQRIATWHDGTPYGQGLIDAASKVLVRSQRGRPVLALHSDDRGTDFSGQLGALHEAAPDLLLCTLADFQVEALLPQLDATGLSKLRLLGSDTLKTPRLQSASHGSHALYCTTPIVAAQEFLGGQDFLAEFRERHGGEPYYAAHYAYDAVFLLAETLRRIDSLDRRALLEGLKRFNGDVPVTGIMRFDRDGEQRGAAVGIYHLQRGRWELAMRSSNW